jgi:hypothetical protein
VGEKLMYIDKWLAVVDDGVDGLYCVALLSGQLF